MGHGPWVLIHEKTRFSGIFSSRWPPVLLPAVGLWYFRFFFRPVIVSASPYADFVDFISLEIAGNFGILDEHDG